MSDQQIALDDAAMTAWIKLVSGAVNNAISGLADMVGQEIIITSFNTRQMQVKDACDLVGGPEALTVAVYLSVVGPTPGHMLIIYQPQVAFDLVDLLMGQPEGYSDSMGELESSAMAEMGNVAGSFFLNALADATGLNLRVSPPAVMNDMLGAVLDSILADVMLETDDALMINATFGTSNRQLNGTFLAMPSLALQRSLLERWGSA